MASDDEMCKHRTEYIPCPYSSEWQLQFTLRRVICWGEVGCGRTCRRELHNRSLWWGVFGADSRIRLLFWRPSGFYLLPETLGETTFGMLECFKCFFQAKKDACCRKSIYKSADNIWRGVWVASNQSISSILCTQQSADKWPNKHACVGK